MAGERDGDSFRIGDVRRPKVEARRPRGKQPSEVEEAPSVGFPAVEGWLERSSMDELVDAMRPRYEALEAMSTGGNLREKGSATKAMAAYERVADLFEYLYATKDSLQGHGEEG